jgi:hypothetical protein
VANRFARASLGLAGAALFAVLAASAALAGAAPVRIDYHAEPGCPDTAAFLRAVAALTPNAQAPEPGARARRFTVRIERARAELIGRLHIEEIDGVGAEREVRAPTCNDVVAALALVTALAIDAGPIDAPPPASASASPSSAPPPPPRPSATIPAPPATSAPPSSSAVPRPPPPPPAFSASGAVPLPPPPPPSPTTWAPHLELGAAANAWGAVAPRAAWGGSAFLDWSGWGPTDFTPSVRLGVGVAESPPSAAGRGSAAFRLVAVRVAGCPFLLATGPLVTRPCVGLDFGALHGMGSGLIHSFRQTRTWGDLGVGPRLQLRLGRSWVLEGEATLLLPLIRDTFVFEQPRTIIHEVPVVSAAGALGLGWLFP